MATVNEKMTNLADAIREKTGTTEPLSLDQMAIEVRTMSNNGEETGQPAYLDKVGLQRLWYHISSRLLPVVTSENNGATLQVVNGEWVAMAPVMTTNESGGLTVNIGG